MVFHQLRDELDLSGVHVLILVDDDVLELRRQLLSQCVAPLQKELTLGDDIAKVP